MTTIRVHAYEELVLLYANGVKEVLRCVPGDTITARNIVGFSVRAVDDDFLFSQLFGD